MVHYENNDVILERHYIWSALILPIVKDYLTEINQFRKLKLMLNGIMDAVCVEKS